MSVSILSAASLQCCCWPLLLLSSASASLLEFGCCASNRTASKRSRKIVPSIRPVGGGQAKVKLLEPWVVTTTKRKKKCKQKENESDRALDAVQCNSFFFFLFLLKKRSEF